MRNTEGVSNLLIKRQSRAAAQQGVVEAKIYK